MDIQPTRKIDKNIDLRKEKQKKSVIFCIFTGMNFRISTAYLSIYHEYPIPGKRNHIK